MGCICSKGKSANEYTQEHVHDQDESKASKSLPLVWGEKNDATARLISNPSLSRTPIEGDKNGRMAAATAKPLVHMPSNVGLQPRVSRVFSVTRGEKGAQVLAGWPSWLTAVAGEAISGWIPRRPDSFEKLDKASSILSSLPFFYCFHMINF